MQLTGLLVTALISLAALLLGLVGGLLIAHIRMRLAEKQAETIIEEAKQEAERVYKERLLSAQAEIQELREREEKRLKRRVWLSCRSKMLSPRLTWS